MNEMLGYAPLYFTPWPKWDPAALVEDETELAIQVNGKVRGRIVVAANANNDEIQALALAQADIKAFLEGKTIRKVIVVKNIVNIVAN